MTPPSPQRLGYKPRDGDTSFADSAKGRGTRKEKGAANGPFVIGVAPTIYFLAIAALTSSASSATRALSDSKASVWPLLYRLASSLVLAMTAS
jgi:hypothetical protein